MNNHSQNTSPILLKPKRRYVLLLLLPLLVSACGINKKHKDEQSDCSCAKYFGKTKSPRPSWVDTEGLINGVYYSQGVAECTGLKSIDVKESSTVARGNLANMLQSEVSSEVLLIRQSDSATRSGSEKGRVQTAISSASMMKNSSIYTHWVDPETCLVYSAVKLDKLEIDKALAEAEEQEKNKLKNQLFTTSASGEYADQIQLSLTKALSESGVSLISNSVDETESEIFTFSGKLVSINTFKENKLVRVSLFLSINNPSGKTIWSNQVDGKAVSFVKYNEEFLIRSAVESALKKVKDQLNSTLEKTTNQS